MSGTTPSSGDLPVTAPAGTRRSTAAWPGRVALAHVVVALLGTGILLWVAAPFSGPVTESLPNAGYWQLLAASAVVVGGIGGGLEGLALRCGRPLLAVAVLVAASVPGLWLPLLTLGRWFPDQGDDLIGTGSVVGGIAGWLMLVVVLASVAAISVRLRAP
jgi:hypothetical protein